NLRSGWLRTRRTPRNRRRRTVLSADSRPKEKAARRMTSRVRRQPSHGRRHRLLRAGQASNPAPRESGAVGRAHREPLPELVRHLWSDARTLAAYESLVCYIAIMWSAVLAGRKRWR